MAGGPSGRDITDGRSGSDSDRGPVHTAIVCSVGYGVNAAERDSATCGRAFDGTNIYCTLFSSTLLTPR
jgi:hypothetical protein